MQVVELDGADVVDQKPKRAAGFDRYPANAIDADAVAEARRYCDEIDERLNRGEGIWFIGPKGTGKTQEEAVADLRSFCGYEDESSATGGQG